MCKPALCGSRYQVITRETYWIEEGLIKPVMGMEKEKVVSANCGEEMVGCMV